MSASQRFVGRMSAARTLIGVAVLGVVFALGGCGGGGGGSDGGGSSGALSTPEDVRGSALPQMNTRDGAPPPANVAGSPRSSEPAQADADPKLPAQWHLQDGPGGLRAVRAWATSRGGGARVNIIDDGVEITHDDLAPNILPGAGWNYRTGNRSPLPSGPEDSHGTSVAGIIGARDANAVGGAGVAPRAGLAGYNPLSTGRGADMLDALASGFNVTGVSNNSWGSFDNGVLHRVDTLFAEALLNGVTHGRGGLGIVYVFPSGNGGVLDNSNYDGYVNRFGALTVCATDNLGQSPDYSEPGANVLVCGPGGTSGAGMITTAIGNSYRPASGAGAFFGTSAAAPSVSGVVALMLGVRPDLSWRDVRLILAETARQPAASGGEGTDGWRPFNSRYGFGVVDAVAALDLAGSWPTVGTTAQLRKCEVASGAAGFPIRLPDAPSAQQPGATQTSRLVVPADCGGGISHIEFIEIGFDASGAYSGDLRVELVSPAGAISVLATERGCAGDRATNPCGTYSGWTFGSVRHLNEAATGTWTLRVTDRLEGDLNTWNSWNLRIWGR